ncbi:protein of unknown function [Pseudomonas mediterranea]
MGAGLPAKAAEYSTSVQAGPQLSRAGSLPQWFLGECRICTHPRTLWERACPRRRRNIQHQCKLTHSFREQARSHNGSWVNAGFAHTLEPCGSEPARDGGGESATAIAGKTDPHIRITP